MVEAVIVRLEKAALVSVIHQEPAFSEMFISHPLGRSIRVEADLCKSARGPDADRRRGALSSNLGNQ